MQRSMSAAQVAERETCSKSKPRRSLPQLPQGVKPLRPSGGGRQVGRKTPQTSTSSLTNDTLDLTTVSELPELSQTILLNRTDEAGTTIDSTMQQQTPKRDIISPVRFARSGEGEDSSVTVAVRVRPLSDREIRQQAKQVIRMHNNETIITSSDGVQHRFYYDHCFWSVKNNDINFADQKRVYKELAQPLLDWSFQGYNTCLFAYGQTGSGKSYCIMGEGEARGVVPQFSQELFDRIEGTVDSETVFEVQVSYYEIYKEMIYDLLASTKHKVKHKLRVREHPVMGPYVEDLSTYVATSFSDIEHWINVGNRFRATATTGMNDRSSRSHAVFTILLTQTSILEGEEHNKVSRINLIDLAGSERSSVSKTSGERLKEGASINRSLHALGKVISLLSEKSTGKRKKAYIPYRDSTLTWLLKESLGGNSKTAMIATISPANLHYEESLSTLRYAQQARTIINVARVNEDPNAAIIRDLRQEIGYLKSLLGERLDPASSVEVKELREKLRESEKLMSEVTRTWQQKLSDTETRKKEELDQLKKSGSLKVNNRLPNLVNLTEDPQLSEILLYVLKEGVTTVGQQDGAKSHDIKLTGAVIVDSHCQFVNEDGSVTIEPSTNGDAQTFVNGELITTSVELHHGDRVVLGGEYFFRFNSPAEVEKGVNFKKGKGSFEFARNELMSVQTARLEAELEEKRLKERESMMVELQSIKNAAQEEMDRQKSLYEEKLSELAKEMEEQSMEVSIHQRTKEETETKLEELLRQKQLLEEETLAQKHIIQLEQMKTEKEYAEMREQKSKLMMELEKEKNKLEGDISKLSKNKQIRESRRESTISNTSTATLDGRGSELVKMSMMLHEASAICKGLNKSLTFSRDEAVNEHGELQALVRVTNTQLGQVTHWDQAKFESRLEQMRDIYQNMSHGSVASLDESVSSAGTSGEEADPFYDPTDSWVKDSMLTPHPSPHRAAQLRRSLLSASSSPSLQSPSIKVSGGGPRSMLEMLSNSLGSWTAGSPSLGTPDQTTARKNSYFQFSQSVPRVCCDKISSILKEGGLQTVSVYQSIVDHVHQMRKESRMLEEAYDGHAPTPDLNVPFSELTNVRLHTISLYASLESLLESVRSLQEQCRIHEALSVSVSGVAGHGMKGLAQQSCEQLIKAVCQQTALYCSKLLQGIESEVEDSIKESCHHLDESLDSVVKLTGQLCLARRTQDKLISSRLHHSSNDTSNLSQWLFNDDFLSLHPYQTSAALFYQGHCEWCTLSLEWATHTIQDRLTHLGQTKSNPENSQTLMLELVKRIISTVLTFLQRLSEMQVSIWNLDNSNVEEGTLPLTPNLHHTVDMLFRLQQVQNTISSITEKVSEPPTSGDQLSSSNAQVAHCCNELAASVLAVIKSSSSEFVQELSHEVQALSHEVARAGKNLNHLIKKGLKTSKATPHQSINVVGAEKKTKTERKGTFNGVSQTENSDDVKTVEENHEHRVKNWCSENSNQSNSETQTISESDAVLPTHVLLLDTPQEVVIHDETTESHMHVNAVKSLAAQEETGPSIPITEQAPHSNFYSVSSPAMPEPGKCQTEKTSLATGQVQYMPDSPIHSSPPPPPLTTTIAVLNSRMDSDDDESSLI